MALVIPDGAIDPEADTPNTTNGDDQVDVESAVQTDIEVELQVIEGLNEDVDRMQQKTEGLRYGPPLPFTVRIEACLFPKWMMVFIVTLSLVGILAGVIEIAGLLGT